MDTVSPGFPPQKTPAFASPGSLDKLEPCRESVSWEHEFIANAHYIPRSQ